MSNMLADETSIHDIQNSDVRNLLSFSGGKDSTALLLHAIETDVEFEVVFADTGHEHQITYDYLGYIEEKLDVKLIRVKKDFTEEMAKKREYIKSNWGKEKIINFYGKKSIRRALTEDEIEVALNEMQPSGNPMEDMLRRHGRGPLPRERFCSIYLKQQVIADQVYQPLIDQNLVPVSWQGVRAQESNSRAKMLPVEVSESMGFAFIAYRPLLLWSHDDVFRMHKRHGIKWNPLYDLGMSRVGCMPCICVTPTELKHISKKLPDVIVRIEELEEILKKCSRNPKNRHAPTGAFILSKYKREDGTFFGIREMLERMDAGQFDMFQEELNDPDLCEAAYPIICE